MDFKDLMEYELSDQEYKNFIYLGRDAYNFYRKFRMQCCDIGGIKSLKLDLFKEDGKRAPCFINIPLTNELCDSLISALTEAKQVLAAKKDGNSKEN